MILPYKAVIVTGAITGALAIVGLTSAVTINQPEPNPKTVSTIPFAQGETMTYPNVTPQTATGGFQGSDVQVQTTIPFTALQD